MKYIYLQMKYNIKLLFTLILSLSINYIVNSQELIFKSECFIGDEIHKQKIDTIFTNQNINLEFYSKNFENFVPTYFPKKLKNKKPKPIIIQFENGYRVEYYNENNLLKKYSITEGNSQTFDVNIFYLDNNYPYKLIEYFPVLQHSENGLFSIQYYLRYNDKNDLVEIETVDNYGYLCRIKLINSTLHNSSFTKP